MKLKNVVLTVLASCAILTGLLPSISNADDPTPQAPTPTTGTTTTGTTSRELGIVSLREGGRGYQVNGKTVWKIVEYKNSAKTYNDAIYCIKGGRGFGGETYIENVVYNSHYDLKNIAEIPASIRTILPSSEERTETINGTDYTYTDFNAVLWLLDNAYLPKDENSATMKENLMNLVFPNETVVLTDDDIEVVQQCAIWYFTNNNPSDAELYAYHMDDSVAFPAVKLARVEGGEYDLDLDFDRQTQADILYKYLIKNAKILSDKYGDGVDREASISPAQLQNTQVKAELIGGKCIIGPIRISQVREGYTLTGVLTDQNDTELAYTLLDSTKQPVATGTTLKDLVNTDFYLQIVDRKEITGVKFTIEVTYDTRETIFWTVGGAEVTNQPVVEVKSALKTVPQSLTVQIDRKEFDLALRKFITSINGVATTNRVPEVDTAPLKTATTAIYEHSKMPLSVAPGDIVTYKIRVYNEGQVDGYVEQIADYLPEGLGFILDYNVNLDNSWVVADGQTIKTVKLTTIPNATNNLSISNFTGVTDLSKVDVVTGKVKIVSDKLKYSATDTQQTNLIRAFDEELNVLSYKEVEVVCVVLGDVDQNTNLKNIAEIQKCVDGNGNQIRDVDTVVNPEDGYIMEDRDSLPGNVDITTYPENTNVQDDDDFERLVVKDFDLALRKFITAVGKIKITDRNPMPVINTTTGTITYEHPKDVVRVKNGDLVEYTIRIYNEGSLAGYATEVKDVLPKGLEFVADNEINQQYGWELKTSSNDTGIHTTITTKYLSRESNTNNLIPAFDRATMNSPEYKDLKVVCRVNLPDDSSTILINTAEIQDDANSSGGDVTDKDSTPGNNIDGEDDIDIEKVQIVIFDLALRKFITQVNDVSVTDRVPDVVIDETGKISYHHKKDPVLVKNNDIVTYTIRLYNEGNIPGYVQEVKDDVPQGLIFVPDHPTNIEYRWIASSDGSIRTDYLSKEQDTLNEISAFEKNTMTTPDFRDVKVAFRVDESNLPDGRIIINTAEISKDLNDVLKTETEISNNDDNNNQPTPINGDGNRDIDDEDSTPDNDILSEDDIDKEYLRVQYFDLALLKYITQVQVTEDGELRTIDTGHTGLENPEPFVKVEINKRKIETTIVKFVYTIKITNEGEIAGYAMKVLDRIPQGLEFVQEDNPDWYTIGDGKVITEQLSNTLLNPGESATVQITLRWINSEDNLKEKVNVAEIYEDYNESNSKDIDSTPNNDILAEDDQDDATVLLSIKTGIEPSYIGIVSASVVILAIGIGFIRKYIV